METIDFETPTLDAKGQVIARTPHSAQQFTEDLGKGVSLEMIVIPAGSFQMGSPRDSGSIDEQPQHFVTIKSFLMGKYLVTQREWKAMMGKLPPCRFKGENLPVERVTWNEAQTFCQRLSQKTGRNYHLPSETQWEYTCRAGTTTLFHFGETLTSDYANYNGEHIFKEEPRGIYFHATNEGGKFPPNAFGLYDMHGNLWEWCTDNWLGDYSSSPRNDSAYQMHTSPYHVARGGCWHETPNLCRSAARIRFAATDAEEYVGLRVVCDLPIEIKL